MRNTVLAGAILSLLFAGAVGGGCGGSTVSGTDAGGGGDGATPPEDASSDGRVCVTLDPLTFNQRCTQDSECTLVTTGQLCTGGCDCGGTAINKSDVAKYNAETAGVQLLACPCAFPGETRCVHSACTLCTFGPNAPPGCPDAG